MYFVYILTNRNHKVLYTGVTNDLGRRMYEHKKHLLEGFTKRYKVTKLVYYAEFKKIEEAIAFEKQVKGWTRAKKELLIASVNPEWKELPAE